MAETIKFEDFSKEVIEKFNDVVMNWLEEASGEVESQVIRNSRVDTGQTKGSYKHKVDESKYEAHIGSPNENAIWEEFGTGIFAENGNGRKTPWTYKKVSDGKFYRTKGKKPNKPLRNAMTQKKSEITEILKRKLRRLK